MYTRNPSDYRFSINYRFSSERDARNFARNVRNAATREALPAWAWQSGNNVVVSADFHPGDLVRGVFLRMRRIPPHITY